METCRRSGATSTSTFQRTYLQGIEFLGGGTTSPRQAFVAGTDVIAKMTSAFARTLRTSCAAAAPHGKRWPPSSTR